MATFSKRHIGGSVEERKEMLKELGLDQINQLVDKVIPDSIRLEGDFDIPPAISEQEFLELMRARAQENEVYKNYIGRGYYGTHTPSVILRNIFENPGWYTQYTPYQAEISQGRLEALINFQTMVADLTGLPLANASLLDEATAAAEAMSMLEGIANKKRKKNPATRFFVDEKTFDQTIDVLKTRAEPMGIEIVTGDWKEFEGSEEFFGVLVQYPNSIGEISDYRNWAANLAENGIKIAVAADLMSLCLLSPPGEWGADVAVGTTQRFGIPLGAGGPHAAYFATREDYKRRIPGRIIGVSVDRDGRNAFRMALQTREQHIKRDRATSNICTAQALLAIMAGMYGVYHGPDGLRKIARNIYDRTRELARGLFDLGLEVINTTAFDTITLELEEAKVAALRSSAENAGYNFWYDEDYVSISLDETTQTRDVQALISIFREALGQKAIANDHEKGVPAIPAALERTSAFLDHEVFHRFRSETELMRYIKRLENQDLSLTHSMISLGSCTMKLNAASQLIPLSWPEFANIHPFAPQDQQSGYMKIIEELAAYLTEITGFAACSFQPNSGAQGEFAGLLTIREYHKSRGDHHRDLALIPESAHGTNPASAVMAGMKVVVVKCDEHGNIDLDDVKEKVNQHSDRLSAMMITYPSTHGVFEREIVQICDLVHEHGGMMYMDGANMNAQVGFTSPAAIHADVCHLNLHKTFAIPHGGGGPGMGPICANEALAPFLPRHRYQETGEDAFLPISAAPYGSPLILLVSYGYIKMLGAKGLQDSSAAAILNANYLKRKLADQFSILYTGPDGYCAHEFIVDLRPFKSVGVGVEDVAKRLVDYGFHAPTMSFPVAGTIMIEPTESESKEELDRFLEAMFSIKEEIDRVASGDWDAENNPLLNAPHCIQAVTADEWNFPYSRKVAAYPIDFLSEGHKFWVNVSRIDNAYGDRNLMCTCPPMEDYQMEE